MRFWELWNGNPPEWKFKQSLFDLSAAQLWFSVFPPLILRCKMEVREESFRCLYPILSALSTAIWDFFFFFWRFLRSSWNYYPLLFIEMNKSLKKKNQLTSSRISLYTFKLVLLLSLFLPPSIMSNCVVVINNLREKHLLVHLSQSVCFSWKNGISQFFQVNIFPLLSFQFQILSRRIFIVS